MEYVLTLKISEEWFDEDLERARILVRSMSHFWEGKKRLSLKIVTPSDDYNIVSREIKSTSKVDISVIAEDDVIYCLGVPNHYSPYHRQRVLKLAYAVICSSQFYLNLNADLICVRNFSSETLIVDDKALTDWEPRNNHPDWWEGSAKVLDVPVMTNALGMGVTPNILARDVVLDLFERLSRQDDGDPMERLLKNYKWTEYSLYNTFAESIGAMTRRHHDATWMAARGKAIMVPNDRPYNFWSAEHFKRWNPDGAFMPTAKGLFMVCQSSSRVPAADVWEKVKMRFE